MGEFKVHRSKFFDYMSSGIQCIAYEKNTENLAVGKEDGSIDIWKIGSRWHQYKIIPGSEQRKVNSLAWVKGRLFSAGLQGDITEYDLGKLSPKVSHFYGHGFWCMSANHKLTRLVLGCEDSCVRIFRILDKGAAFEKSCDFQKERIVSLAWHLDDEIIVTGSIDNISVWQVSTGRVKQRISMARSSKNQELVVWCVAILRDFTIVSGDSDGKTQFWNGKNGTLLQSISSHKAAILSLCVSPKEDIVVTAGVDPHIIQFGLVTANFNSSEQEWRKSSINRDSFHDVKALACTNKLIISGGVDTILRGFPLHRSAVALSMGQLHKLQRHDLPFPQKLMVHLAEKVNLLLCQHQSHLDLWRLGSVEKAEIEDVGDGETVDVKLPPCKLLQLNSNSGEHIVCSAISPCGQWLAFSTIEKLRLYKLTISPLSIHKVQVLTNSVHPSHHLAFIGRENRLLSASNQRSLQLLSLDSISPTLLHTYAAMEHPIAHLLSTSNGSIAIVADEHGVIKLFNLQNPSKEITSIFPHYDVITTMAINKSNSMLFVVFVDRTFVEYALHQQSYSKWTCGMQKKGFIYPDQWIYRQKNIFHAAYNPANMDQILLVDHSSFTLVDKTKKPPSRNEPLFRSKHSKKRQRNGHEKPKQIQQANHCLIVCEKFTPLLYAGFLSEPGEILMIERPITAIQEKLPPAFYRKKYGT